MILKPGNRAKQWQPDGFAEFRTLYPATAWPGLNDGLDRSQAFRAAWLGQHRPPESLAVVLTPGLFAEWLPGCFRQAYRGFRAVGIRCLKTSVRTGRSVPLQATRLAHDILDWLEPGERFIWCTHSKGGIDALWALQNDPELRERCHSAALMQLPVGYSWVVDDIERRPAGLPDRMLRMGFRIPLFAGGIKDISTHRNAAVDAWLRSLVAPVPLVHGASWSIDATSWVDSWHARLNRLRPGHAHDGQFFLTDQRLEGLPAVCLPRLDHAQPVLGGLGFDVSRFWMSFAAIAVAEAVR